MLVMYAARLEKVRPKTQLVLKAQKQERIETEECANSVEIKTEENINSVEIKTEESINTVDTEAEEVDTQEKQEQTEQ